ncbi:MAG: chlorophyllide reductase iron protein subunit X, partial [Pseudomonadota bacterium]
MKGESMTLAATKPVDAHVARLRTEAAETPDPVSTAPATKSTQVIAIYGKGGIGKSFTLSNL